MEQNPFKTVSPIPQGRPEDARNAAASSKAHQSRRGQRYYFTRQRGAHVRQPTITRRVSRQQFQQQIRLLNAQYQYSRQRPACALRRQNAVRHRGPQPRHPQRLGDNNTIAPETEASATGSTKIPQEPSRQSYVERHREAQQVHTKVHPGEVQPIPQPQELGRRHRIKDIFFKRGGDSDQPQRRRDILRQMVSGKSQQNISMSNASPFGLRFEQSSRPTPPPNWPFGVNPAARRNENTKDAQYHPLTHREIHLILGNPLIRDGNMGPLPAPAGVTPPPPPPHVFGIASEPEMTSRRSSLDVPRVEGLRRSNAQRRTLNPQLQEQFEGSNNRFRARFRRGSEGREVYYTFETPMQLARQKSVLPQIQEASCESSDSGSIHTSEPDPSDAPEVDLDGETPADQYQHQEMIEVRPRWEHRSLQYRPRTPDGQAAPPVQKPQHQGSGGEQPSSTGTGTLPEPRQFKLVVRGPRPAPASLYDSSSTSTRRSSAVLTAATRASTPPLEPEPEPHPKPQLWLELEQPAQKGAECGTSGCMGPECSRIQRTSGMPVPGAGGEIKPEGVGSSAAETRSEDDIVSIGNGLSFLRLN